MVSVVVIEKRVGRYGVGTASRAHTAVAMVIALRSSCSRGHGGSTEITISSGVAKMVTKAETEARMTHEQIAERATVGRRAIRRAVRVQVGRL